MKGHEVMTRYAHVSASVYTNYKLILFLSWTLSLSLLYTFVGQPFLKQLYTYVAFRPKMRYRYCRKKAIGFFAMVDRLYFYDKFNHFQVKLKNSLDLLVSQAGTRVYLA